MMQKITTTLAMFMLIIIIAACAPASQGTKMPDATGTLETPSGMETVTVDLTASMKKMDELIAMVKDYVTSGEITGQAENGLLMKLETIKQKLLNGKINPAANEMGAFINQVQAQSGKKITEPAATALIAKAQEVAAELMAGIPVTGGEKTEVPAPTLKPTDVGIPSVTPMPTDATTGLTKPTPMGDLLGHQAQWDALALQVAQTVGFSTFDYDLFQLPANTSWEDTLAYYETEAAAAGWGDAPSQTNEMSIGHLAVWSATGADGKTKYFVVAQVDAPNGTYNLNLFGSK
jgi:hypothetical protein